MWYVSVCQEMYVPLHFVLFVLCSSNLLPLQEKGREMALKFTDRLRKNPHLVDALVRSYRDIDTYCYGSCLLFVCVCGCFVWL